MNRSRKHDTKYRPAAYAPEVDGAAAHSVQLAWALRAVVSPCVPVPLPPSLCVEASRMPTVVVVGRFPFAVHARKNSAEPLHVYVWQDVPLGPDRPGNAPGFVDVCLIAICGDKVRLIRAGPRNCPKNTRYTLLFSASLRVTSRINRFCLSLPASPHLWPARDARYLFRLKCEQFGANSQN